MKNIFISYAHEDAPFKQELIIHLESLRIENLLEFWHDDRLDAGDKWEPAINEKLNSADIYVFLVSKYFLASRYCRKELSIALKRREQHEHEVWIIPVLVSDCVWQFSPFGALQMRPYGAKPIAEWENHDKAWLQVIQAILSRESLSAYQPPSSAEAESRAATITTVSSATSAPSRRSQFEQISKDDRRRAGITGHWKGIITQPRGPKGYEEVYEIVFELWMEEHVVVGTATFDYGERHIVCACRGGFVEGRIVRLDYDDTDRLIMRYGTVFFELSTDSTTLNGQFLGYATEMNGLAWGEIAIRTQP